MAEKVAAPATLPGFLQTESTRGNCMSIGWIKVHRQTLDNGWLKNHRLWVFWSYCLLKAAHANINVTVGFQRVPLETGQFIYGRDKAAAELDMTVRQVRTCLDCLKDAGNVTIKTTSRFSIITVVNWDSYQDIKTENDQQNDQQTTSKRPANDHNMRIKEKKNTKTSPFADEFAQFWEAYPLKTKKLEARKAWAKCHPPLREVLSTLKWQTTSEKWTKDEGKFIPHPTTWLNSGMWEDEPVVVVVPKCTAQGSTYADIMEIMR